MHYCEWCGEPHDDEETEHHEVIVNLHMHTRTMPELIRAAAHEVLWLLATHVEPGPDRKHLTEKVVGYLNETDVNEEAEDLGVLTEILDDVEAIVNDHIPGLLAISDGGATGDWLVITT